MNRLYRLKSEADFARVAKSKKTAYGKFLGMKMRENHLSHSRFGVVIGLKVAKKANVRNKLRRQIREIIRKELGHVKKGFDVMILGKKTALELEYSELEKEILGLFKKIGLLQ